MILGTFENRGPGKYDSACFWQLVFTFCALNFLQLHVIGVNGAMKAV